MTPKVLVLIAGVLDPVYMIVNLAMGSKYFGGVGLVSGESPDEVAFEIDRISVYQIDGYSPSRAVGTQMP